MPMCQELDLREKPVQLHQELQVGVVALGLLAVRAALVALSRKIDTEVETTCQLVLVYSSSAMSRVARNQDILDLSARLMR